MIAQLARVIVIAAAVLAAPRAHAQVLDLSALKCKDFVELPKDTINAITLWLEGYLTDEGDPVVLDLDQMKAKAERLMTLCGQNPDMTVLAAGEDVMGK
jgi:acid stress chaperone HdeB